MSIKVLKLGESNDPKATDFEVNPQVFWPITSVIYSHIPVQGEALGRDILLQFTSHLLNGLLSFITIRLMIFSQLASMLP